MKNVITRNELKEIHNIACDTWKKKIEKFGSRNPFSNELEFSKEEIQEMINACSDSQLPVVKKIFNIVDRMERVKSVEDACKILGKEDEEVIELRLLIKMKARRKTIALQELVVITKALNDGWEGDWDNSSQYKYILWWYLGKEFRLYNCNYFSSNSYVPARLCHKTREVALYSAKQFFDIWKDAFNS